MAMLSAKGSPSSGDTRNHVSPFSDAKSRQSLETFNKFCDFILAYEASQEKYEIKENIKRDREPTSPSGSSVSSLSSVADSVNGDRRRSLKRPKAEKSDNSNEEYDSGTDTKFEATVYIRDDESWNAITCFCNKPFAGRPMIECSSCLTWIHLSCGKIRKSQIPELFICQPCRDNNHTLPKNSGDKKVSNKVKKSRKSRDLSKESTSVKSKKPVKEKKVKENEMKTI